MNYELIFLDVDGTLKQEPYGISTINKEAIKKACQAGKKVSIASGRNKDLLMETIKELNLSGNGSSYTVGLNGAHIFENSSGKTLHTEAIPMDLTHLLHEKAFELEVSCHTYTENEVYFNCKNFQYIWYHERNCTCKLIDLSKKDLGIQKDPLKFFIMSKENEKLEQFKAEMDTITNGILNAEFSSKYSLEYTSIHASKGLGMEYVCNLYGIPISKAIAAGDGENDISMLRMAGLGIAMKNALESVKAVADTITECTCKENGVTEVIHKYLLA